MLHSSQHGFYVQAKAKTVKGDAESTPRIAKGNMQRITECTNLVIFQIKKSMEISTDVIRGTTFASYANSATDV